MTSNSPTAYPAEYYYPEFIDSRADDPLNLHPTHVPLTTSIDNGISSSTKVPTNVDHTNKTIIKTKPINKKQTSTGLALDVVTDQGLPDADITQALRTDPKRHLLRDPAAKNMPRLIVDDSVIKQTVRTPRIVTTNLDDDNIAQTTRYNQIDTGRKSLANGHVNGDLTKKTKFAELPPQQYQQPIKYIEDEEPIDDYWKKQVLINDEGVVSIEPVKYDRNKYEGPFGLTRQGSLVFFITLGIITALAAVFLIITGLFYGQSYPDSSQNTAKLAGIGICAFVFYLGLLLILIGIWHQQYRQENPTQVVSKPNRHDESSAHAQPPVDQHQPYDYSYQQQYDYTPYENYSNPPYASNANEQMLLQQPGAATGAAYYEPVVWPSNVEIEGQPDPKFYQPMDWSLGSYQVNETQSTATLPPAPVTTITNKPEKRKHHHHTKKTVETNPPKPKFDNLFPNSTITEEPLPEFNKAPETTELIKTIAEMEKNTQHNSRGSTLTRKTSNRIQPADGGTDIFSVPGRQHRYGDHHSRRQSHHHQHRRHRRDSYSSCSTCSGSSYDAFHSDVGYNHHHHSQHQYSEPVHKIITSRPYKSRTPSPPRTHRSTYRDTGVGTGHEKKVMRNSDVTNGFEDVPNVRDDRLEQIPVVRRTIIVEPYPAEPTSRITVKPRTDTTGKIRLGKNEKKNGDNETVMHPSTTFTNKKSKKKTNTTESRNNIVEDLTLEDVNDDHDESERSKKKKTTSKSVKNAFYD